MSESTRRFVHEKEGAAFGRDCREIGRENVFREGETLTGGGIEAPGGNPEGVV
jgi:hypothetical protein